MTDDLTWVLISVALAGGLPGDVIDVLVARDVLKSPPSTKMRLSLLVGTWVVFGALVSIVPAAFVKPIAVCLAFTAVSLMLISLLAKPKTH